MSKLLRAIVLVVPARAFAQAAPDDARSVTVGGYLEGYYQLSVQNPSNRLTNERGYDNRSRTFTLQNAAIDVKGETGAFSEHLVLQIGHTPSTYYLAEPTSMGTSSVDTSNGALWKYIQTATVTAKAPRDVSITAGLFLSPIGIETIAVKDDWNWSRSNLTFGLPNYLTGAMAAHSLGGHWTGKLGVVNGWNSVVDDNGYPSVLALAAYADKPTTAQILYLGGIERPTGAPEGQPWRSLFDVIAQTAVTDTIEVAAEVDAGFESGDLGTSWWTAGAGYVRLALDSELYVAARGDYFYARPGQAGGISASPIFWPARWLAEGTATLAYQPVDQLSLRLEYRHDQASSALYFGGDVAIDPTTNAFIPNRTHQDTITLGITSWF